jgi:hypothetical protein
MTLTDTMYWLAAAAALVAGIAALARYRTAATIAALIGCIAVGLYVYEAYRPAPTEPDSAETAAPDNLQLGMPGVPIGWSRLYINTVLVAAPGKPANIATLSIMGRNNGGEVIKLDEAYFLSRIDGTRLDTKIDLGGRRFKVADTIPIPPGGLFFVLSDPIGSPNIGLTPDDFLKRWASLDFVVRYAGTTQTIPFDRDMVLSSLPKP